jgi:hypothetical protein
MKCDTLLKAYLESNTGKGLSLYITLRLLFCRKSRNDILLHQKTLGNCQKSSSFRINGSLVGSVLYAINQGKVYTREISPFRWFLAGMILVVSRVIVEYSDSFNEITDILGENFVLPMNIMTGLLITFYGITFIFSQMDRLMNLSSSLMNFVDFLVNHSRVKHQ